MTQAATSRIAVMLSVGEHPVSHRPRISAADRRAIGVALDAGCGPVAGVHAGQLDANVTYNLFGLGLGTVRTLTGSDDPDVLPLLLAWWQQQRPAVTLFGTQTECGEGTGTLPYFFAEALRLPLISGVVSVSEAGGRFEVTQAPSASRRRKLTVDSPFVGIASSRAASPLGFSHTAAQAGRAETVRVEILDNHPRWAPEPIDESTLRPRSLRSDIGRSLDERLGGILGKDNPVRQRYLNASPEDAARVIVEALQGMGLVKSNQV